MKSTLTVRANSSLYEIVITALRDRRNAKKRNIMQIIFSAVVSIASFCFLNYYVLF